MKKIKKNKIQLMHYNNESKNRNNIYNKQNRLIKIFNRIKSNYKINNYNLMKFNRK